MTMALVSGTRLGPYEILGSLGAGGMGEVYRARDTRLHRTVAIKIVLPEASGDSERRRRFEREARAVASLSHPNICTLHDVGEHDGTAYLVMELLEGETLAARLERGPLSLAEALACAIQIADALDKAHRQGIVHRDLKPANIMLTREGGARSGALRARLLDFGLATLRADAAAGAHDSTATAPMTAAGQILGTLQYMAPEQLEGRRVDTRADIFTFGTVVHEMVTGRRAFEGSSPAGLIGAILNAPAPSIRSVVPHAPPALERLLLVCLARDPDERWSSMHDVLLQLRAVAEAGGHGADAVAVPTRSRERLAWGTAAAATVAALALGIAALVTDRAGRGPEDVAVHVLSIVPPAQTTLLHREAPQIAPDGRRVAFVARDASGVTHLYVRELDRADAVPLPGTDGASQPFWAPDSRRLGFFAQGRLKTIGIGGGQPLALAPAPVPRGGAWNRDDEIIFVGVPNLPLFRVRASGGEVAHVTRPDDIDSRWFPQFLPDGRHYLFLELTPENRLGGRIKVASLDSDDTHDLVPSNTNGVYADAGYLLFRRDGALMAQPLDPQTLRLGGSPVLLTEGVGFNAVTYQALFSVSGSGSVAFQGSTPGARLTWFDREGRPLEPGAPAGEQNNFCLMPDGSRIVYELADPVTGNVDLWMIARGGAPSRLTFDPAADFFPVCSPAGDEIVFASLRRGPPALFRLSIETPGSEVLLLQSPDGPRIPTDWSHDGRFVVYSALNRETTWDVEMLSLADGRTQPLVATPAEERNAQLSPDGRWMAYVSNESGTFEVYVQRIPVTTGRWQVSAGGGLHPRWGADGRELYYLKPDGSLISVAVSAGTGGVTFGEPRLLMYTRVAGWEPADQTPKYAVTRDGQRVLVNAATDAAASISLAVNSLAALAR